MLTDSARGATPDPSRCGGWPMTQTLLRGGMALGALGLAACTAPPAPSLAAATAPRGEGVFLPFLNAPAAGNPLADVPRLHVSFGGATTAAEMDTGSTGVLVAARLIPGWERLPALGRARLTYSSSGRIMEGTWVMTPVTVSGADGAAVTTQPMPVMAVTRMSCLPEARDCEPEEAPRHVAMLGIGFARQGDHQAQSTPDHNPFLRLPAMADASLGRGYVVTRTGVRVGVSRSAPEAGFATVQLTRNDRYPDWSAAPACVTIADPAQPACGTVLVDTGVPRMFLTVPEAQLVGRVANDAVALPAGTRVSIDLRAGAARGGMGYSFTAGEQNNPLAPSAVTLVGAGRRAPFVNTSFHLLNGFDYLYDADRGLVGYRHVAP